MGEEGCEYIVIAMQQAEQLRKNAEVSLVEKPKKLSKLLDKLKEQGFHTYVIAGISGDIKMIKIN